MRLPFRPVTLALALIITASTLTGCKKEETGDARNMGSSDAPDIALSAAPNVAFRYDYRFALAAKDIAAVQERHAAACESLGLARCRITGVVFRRNGDDYVQAELALKLAPDVARKFGKDATAAVEAARGILNQVEIGGEDQSAALQSSDETSESAKSERERLERQLADRSTPGAVRSELERQIAAQRDAERSAAREGRDARALVGATPMRLSYSTDGFAPALTPARTAKGALAVAATLINWLMSLAIVLAALAVPIGLLLLAAAHGRRFAQWLWQRLGPKPAILAD